MAFPEICSKTKDFNASLMQISTKAFTGTKPDASSISQPQSFIGRRNYNPRLSTQALEKSRCSVLRVQPGCCLILRSDGGTNAGDWTCWRLHDVRHMNLPCVERVRIC